jgi:hypothetical protein
MNRQKIINKKHSIYFYQTNNELNILWRLKGNFKK